MPATLNRWSVACRRCMLQGSLSATLPVAVNLGRTAPAWPGCHVRWHVVLVVLAVLVLVVLVVVLQVQVANVPMSAAAGVPACQ